MTEYSYFSKINDIVFIDHLLDMLNSSIYLKNKA